MPLLPSLHMITLVVHRMIHQYHSERVLFTQHSAPCNVTERPFFLNSCKTRWHIFIAFVSYVLSMCSTYSAAPFSAVESNHGGINAGYYWFLTDVVCVILEHRILELPNGSVCLSTIETDKRADPFAPNNAMIIKQNLLLNWSLFACVAYASHRECHNESL